MMTIQEIKLHAETLNLIFSDEDCQYIIDTSYDGEKVKEAVDDYLRAFGR
jgi:hypothetical protein